VNSSTKGTVRGPLAAWQVAGAAVEGADAKPSPADRTAAATVTGLRKYSLRRIIMSRGCGVTAYNAKGN
jgi:hypothetical protein